jgi:hypothetical protein
MMATEVMTVETMTMHATMMAAIVSLRHETTAGLHCLGLVGLRYEWRRRHRSEEGGCGDDGRG